MRARTRQLVIDLVLVVLLGTFLLSSVPDSGAATTLNTHTVVTDGSGKIIPWNSSGPDAYDGIVRNSWDYFVNRMPNARCGLKMYFCESYMNPDTQQGAGWPHNPGGLYSMLTESAIEWYRYSGDAAPLGIAQNLLDYQLAHGMTAATDNWPSVSYASADAGALTYNGASYGNSTGVGDGTGVIEPDKVAEQGFAFLQMFEQTGNTRYRDAAINAADVLASHVRAGDATHSPWPFRVVAASGAVKVDYSAHTVSALQLFDELGRLGLGNTSAYQAARSTAWNWTLAYPLVNNRWDGYFEDVANSSTFDNTNQLNPMMLARYLLQHPELDPDWLAHVRGSISYVEGHFVAVDSGANTIKEQDAFPHPMGSHTSRYASVNALLYAKTGDLAAKEKAYRAFNWATYMDRANGVNIDGPEVNNQWFTDGYGDFIRHFMVGMAAVPEWAPANQTHLLDATTAVQTITYSPGRVNYTTFDSKASETIKLSSAPGEVTVDGVVLNQTATGDGWSYDPVGAVLTVRHSVGRHIAVTNGGQVSNLPPTVTLTAPTGGATFTQGATVNLAANASDPDGAVNQTEFLANGNVVGTSAAAPYASAWVPPAAGTYTITARATDNAGASSVSAPMTITVAVAAPAGLPAPWANADIGAVGVAGSTTHANGVFTVAGSGADIWGSADSFQYAYQTLAGNGQIVARVVSQQNTHPWALAGVMIRQTLTAGSPEAIASITPGHGYAFTWRSVAGGESSYTAGPAGAAPGWVKLTRSGNVVSAFRSADGVTWAQYATTTVSMPGTVYVGLAVTSHVNTTLATDVFSNVAVTQGSDVTGPAISGIGTSGANQNGATVGWTTDEPSDSQIDYGTTAGYGTSTALNSSLVTNHVLAISGLDAGTTYHYRVKSRDGAGNLAMSADNTFTTPVAPPAEDTQAPSSPAAPVVGQATVNAVLLRWTASTDDVGVTGYEVLRDGIVVGTTTTALTFTNNGLTPNASYVYTLRARDAAGNLSVVSAPTVATTLADTTAPTAPTGLVANTTATQVALSWSPSLDTVGVTGYSVLRNDVQVASVTGTTYTDTTVTTGATYSYAVVGVDAAGNVSDQSNSVSASPTASSLALDVLVTARQSNSASTIVSPAFTTTSANELLVAFLASDGPTGAQSFRSVTGGGLTWTLARRSNTQHGTAEIWTATAPTVVTNLSVTATRTIGSFQGAMAVATFRGAILGSTAGSGAASGAPSVSLVTTRPGSWVWAVGHDWDRAIARTVGAGQTKVHESLLPACDTSWVQRRTAVTPADATTVTINDTAPTNDRWNFAAIEIAPSP